MYVCTYMVKKVDFLDSSYKEVRRKDVSVVGYYVENIIFVLLCVKRTF